MSRLGKRWGPGVGGGREFPITVNSERSFCVSQGKKHTLQGRGGDAPPGSKCQRISEYKEELSNSPEPRRRKGVEGSSPPRESIRRHYYPGCRNALSSLPRGATVHTADWRLPASPGQTHRERGDPEPGSPTWGGRGHGQLRCLRHSGACGQRPGSPLPQTQPPSPPSLVR